MPAPEYEEVFATWTDDVADKQASVVCLCGELDASVTAEFLNEMQQLVARRRNVILDVHLLSYVDSTGVAAMMSVRNALEAAGRSLRLVGCHGLLHKILHITRVDTQIRCFDDLESALEDVD